MAHLNGDDRGQIILIAAFSLAVIFVAMALIVNSAIYTENLASRGETAGSDGALSMRAQVEANVGDAVTAANRNDNDTVDALTTAVNASIRNISEQTGQQSARSGRVINVSNHTFREGQRIYYSGGASFSTPVGEADYQVAEGVSRVPNANGTRAFVIEASDIQASTEGSAFEIKANETGAIGNTNSWRARIWQSGTTIRVKTEKNSGTTTTEVCEVTPDDPTSDVQIDITGGTIDGEECDALGTNATTGENFHFAAGTGVTPGTSDSYDIFFQRAGQIDGDFSMVVNEPTPSSPHASDPALYDVTVNYTYQTADLNYETYVRVAPGEPDV